MADQSQDIFREARQLIAQQRYADARALLNRMPDDPKAQRWLSTLNQMSTTQAAPAPPVPDPVLPTVNAAPVVVTNGSTGGLRASTAVILFAATLLGTLLGAVADFGGTLDTFTRLGQLTWPTLCVVGSDTILGGGLDMGAELGALFASSPAGRNVHVRVEGIGSGAGVNRAIAGGCAHVLAMSEPMTDDQYNRLTEAGLAVACAGEIAYDMVVVITDINNPASAISQQQFVGVLRGAVPNWRQFNTSFDYPITIFARPDSGTTDWVLRQVARYDYRGGTNFPPTANYIPCDSNADCLDATLSTPGALYWVSRAWMLTQPTEYLKVLRVLQRDEGTTDPLAATPDIQRYPRALLRPMYMYVLAGPRISARQRQLGATFVQQVRGVQGQRVVERFGFFTHFNIPDGMEVPLPPGFVPPGTPGRTLCLPPAEESEPTDEALAPALAPPMPAA